MLGVGVDLELQDPVAVEEVCKDRGKRVIFARQRGEEVMNAFVAFASRKVTDVKFRVGGNDNGPCDCATAVFGEEVDENLASRRLWLCQCTLRRVLEDQACCLSERRLSSRHSLCIQREGNEEMEAICGEKDRCRRLAVQGSVRQIVHALCIETGAVPSEGWTQAAEVKVMAYHVHECYSSAVLGESILVLAL